MRPDPNDHSTDARSARIIHLGEVRRRRAGGRRAPDGQYIAALSLLAVFGWALWISVLFSLQPARLLTFIAFFVPLWIALAATSAVVLYVVDWRRGLLARLFRCAARAATFATVACANLAMLAAHRWSVLIAGIIVLAGAGFQALVERRLESRY